MFRVDLRSSAELQDLVRALKAARRDVAKDIRSQTKVVAQRAWQEELTANAMTAYEARFASTGRVKVSDQNVTLQAGKVRGKTFRGGLDLRKSWGVVEFGGNPNFKKTYKRRSPKGKVHNVTLRVFTEFRGRNKKGYVAGPAAGDTGARILSLWVQTAMRTFFDAMGGK